MSHAIWKFPIEIDREYVQIPVKAGLLRYLTAQVQNGIVCVWAIVDTRLRPQTREILVVGTGEGNATEALNRFHAGGYIGTVQQRGMVWHLFDAGLAQGSAPP